MWEKCVQAKVELSSSTSTEILLSELEPPEILALDRATLSGMIGDLVEETLDECERMLRSLDLSWPEVDQCVLTGGSSRVPMVSRLLQERSGRPVRILEEPELAVVRGATALALSTISPSKSPGSSNPPDTPQEKGPEAEEQIQRQVNEPKLSLGDQLSITGRPGVAVGSSIPPGDKQAVADLTASTTIVLGRIFISYRREDTAWAAGWLFDRLAGRFGEDLVFKDVDSIELGDDFVEVITAAVGSCDVLLALIGPQWLTITDEEGQRRIDNAEDFVRLEIEAALMRNIRVIPILVEPARMPRSAQLPPNLAKLARHQALMVSADRFQPDTDRLLKALHKTLSGAQIAVEKGQVT